MATSWEATFRPRRLIGGAVVAVLAAAVAYAVIPRRADLARFDPAEMAQLETVMWRHYYEKRHFALFLDLYRVSRREQGFSPLDSARVAVAAARAARSFQPSTSRAGADAAIPYLEGYFRLLSHAAPIPVDVADAARTELAWWQARREAVPPDQYGAIIARVSTLLYGVDNGDIRRAGVLRAQAMHYRDARSASMREADWSAIRDQLQVAYGLLKKAVSLPRAPTPPSPASSRKRGEGGVGASTPELEKPMSEELPAREAMEFDVVIVGAGPAGLAAAIRLKQLSSDINVVVVEKGSEVGAHILSGAVIDPVGLDKLIPDWRSEDTPIKTAVSDDRFYWLSASRAVRLPNLMMPPLMSNHGNYIVSLGNVCRWLATKAEALGVEIYPGFAAAEVLLDGSGAVAGVATGDMGLAKDGHRKDSFTRGMELRAKYTLFAEGARGSLSKTLLARYGLGEGREPQKFGLGLKELWQVAPEKHASGLVQHSFGWPLDGRTGGGSFLYHFDDNLVSVGFVVHLNYENPYLSPFEEFQRFKTHPLVRATFEGGKRLAYGARALTEGGYQSVPKLAFPGGALIGCAAGFMNVPRIKGSHNAMLSGLLAAEHVAAALAAGRANDELEDYEAAWRSSEIGPDLWKVRNAKPLWSRFGTLAGIALGGFDMWTNTLGFSLFGTLGHGKSDSATLKPAAACAPIAYPKPDGKLTFDRLSSVFLSNTNHEEDQPVHLRVADPSLQKASEYDRYGGPSARYCPAGVYEWVEEGGSPRFVINAQNCVHCKTCDIKDPNRNITWVPPEGGGGPNYPNM